MHSLQENFLTMELSIANGGRTYWRSMWVAFVTKWAWLKARQTVGSLDNRKSSTVWEFYTNLNVQSNSLYIFYFL